jgi:hypothetical protein
VTQPVPPSYKVVFSHRDAATAETRAKAEDSYLRILNSYVQSFAQRDPKFFISMPASHIEYLCQVAFEGKPVEGPAGRSKQIAERIGATDMAKIMTSGKGLINALKSMQSTKAEAIVRKTMINELIMFHRGRIKRKEHISALGFRRKPYPHLDDDCFNLVIPRNQVKGLVWDEETQTSRFRCLMFSDPVKVKGINLTEGHKWHHLRVQTVKNWRIETVDWTVRPISTKLCYIRDSRR